MSNPTIGGKLTGKGLQDAIAQIVQEAQGRVSLTKTDEYGTVDTVQKFENMDIDDLFVYFEEELLDQINYAVMNLIRVRALKTDILKVVETVSNVRYLSYKATRNAHRETET